MFKVKNKNTRTTRLTLLWCFIVDFELVNINWGVYLIFETITLLQMKQPQTVTIKMNNFFSLEQLKPRFFIFRIILTPLVNFLPWRTSNWNSLYFWHQFTYFFIFFLNFCSYFNLFRFLFNIPFTRPKKFSYQIYK